MAEPSAAAPRQALKYLGDGPLNGLPAADVTAEQAATWFTQADVDEAIANKSHKIANQTEAKAIEQAASTQRDGWRRPPAEGAAPATAPTPDTAAPPSDAPKASE